MASVADADCDSAVQRAAKAFARLRLLVGDKLTDLVARKPWIVPEMAAMETKRCGHVVPDGPTARAMVGTSLEHMYCKDEPTCAVLKCLTSPHCVCQWLCRSSS